MKVTDSNAGAISTSALALFSSSARSGARSLGAEGDQIDLSGLGNLMSKVLQDSSDHIAKVANLTTAVSEGRYRVDSGILSGSIIEESMHYGGSYA